MQQHLFCVTMARYIGVHDAMTTENRQKLITELVTRYNHSLTFGMIYRLNEHDKDLSKLALTEY